MIRFIIPEPIYEEPNSDRESLQSEKVQCSDFRPKEVPSSCSNTSQVKKNKKMIQNSERTARIILLDELQRLLLADKKQIGSDYRQYDYFQMMILECIKSLPNSNSQNSLFTSEKNKKMSQYRSKIRHRKFVSEILQNEHFTKYFKAIFQNSDLCRSNKLRSHQKTKQKFDVRCIFLQKSLQKYRNCFEEYMKYQL